MYCFFDGHVSLTFLSDFVHLTIQLLFLFMSHFVQKNSTNIDPYVDDSSLSSGSYYFVAGSFV